MNSDAYSFAKSSSPQGVDQYTPYGEKQWNYINDINSGVYTASNTLVQFDLTSIYNSGQFSDASDLFLTVPIVMQAAWATAAGVKVAPVVGHSALLALKTNFQHLVHQVEVVANGKVVNDTQPYISFYEHFKLASQMSQNDLKQFGPSLGFAPGGLDNEKSVRWQGDNLVATASNAGLGLANNRPFGENTLAVENSATPGLQNQSTINTALFQRATKCVDTSAAYAVAGQGIYGSIAAGASNPASIMTLAQLNNEFKPSYQVIGAGATSEMVWQDLAVIPLKYLCDCIDKMGLVKKLDLILRLYLNTGTIAIDVRSAANTTGYGNVRQSTFVNTCPITINSLGTNIGSAGVGAPANVAILAAGVYVGRSLPSQFSATAPFSFTPFGHFMPACRAYYSLVKLEPSRALAYIEENRSKQVVYENVLFNQYSSISAGGTFSQLVQSGIKNPLGIAIIPFISPATLLNTSAAVAGYTSNSMSGAGLNEQWQSPYDTCPGTFAPLSLTNLQVALGGVNQLQSTLYYTFENFLEQVALAESLTSTDLGIGTGLISQTWWEMNRVYWVDLARGREADKASMRNLTISFNNNNNVAISLMVFTVYLDKLVIDVETGIVKK
jgi:hypothetical protein